MGAASSVFRALSLPGLGLAALVVSLEIVALWLGLGYSVRKVLLGSIRGPRALASMGVALGAGALLFVPAAVWVQAPLQQAFERWAAATLSTADQTLLSLPPALLSGVVQETAKLLAAVSGLVVLRGSDWRHHGGPAGAAAGTIQTSLLCGVTAGAGMGGFESAIVLSVASAAVPAVGVGALGSVLLERVFGTALHASLAGLVVYFWSTGRLWHGLAAAMFTHTLVNYAVLVLSAKLGLAGAWVLETIIVIFASASVVVLLLLVRRRAQAICHSSLEQPALVGLWRDTIG